MSPEPSEAFKSSTMAEILSKMKEDVEGTLELLWKKVDPKDLQPGDHIYCHKRYESYSHHGIYVGEGSVIHFNRTEIKNDSAIIPLPKSQKSSDQPRPPCPDCQYDEKKHLGVIRTCLDCFRRRKDKVHSIRRYGYGAPRLGLLLKKSGTCTTLPSSRSSNEVVMAAKELLKNSKSFGDYDLQWNNCEHFATHCKTGQKHCEQMSFYNKVGKWVKKPVG